MRSYCHFFFGINIAKKLLLYLNNFNYWTQSFKDINVDHVDRSRNRSCTSYYIWYLSNVHDVKLPRINSIHGHLWVARDTKPNCFNKRIFTLVGKQGFNKEHVQNILPGNIGLDHNLRFCSRWWEIAFLMAYSFFSSTDLNKVLVIGGLSAHIRVDYDVGDYEYDLDIVTNELVSVERISLEGDLGSCSLVNDLPISMMGYSRRHHQWNSPFQILTRVENKKKKKATHVKEQRI